MKANKNIEVRKIVKYGSNLFIFKLATTGVAMVCCEGKGLRFFRRGRKIINIPEYEAKKDVAMNHSRCCLLWFISVIFWV
ncbi:hypothetical protein IA57_04170 [Mangrovimonas yunxiaonensis]|uniref:Uncharacterized protein n=1 Tax=Mangrovimonas yunxiaonensis TaxID=1197477 RepID=A0A084TLV9_9FLAO|nr:hypothetical protein IA57_04170 [Mangrovimonas yunxiaonensis]